VVYESLFHCVYPVSTEPVQFKTHPTIPEIEASRCGVVRCKSEDDMVDHFTKKSSQHLVWECWTEEELPAYTNIRFLNMNPYDTSFDNLEIMCVDDPARQERERKFIDNTVEQMLIREKFYGDGRDMVKYFKDLGLTKRYIKAWQKVSPNYNVKQSKEAAL